MRLSKRRKFINHKKRIMYFSLFFLLLFISVGYAYLNAALSINGHTELSANTWNIHFENLAVTDGSVAASTPAAIQSDTTNIVYSVLLDRPGDFYEFEVDVVNAGTIGGKISLVNIQGISSAAEPYLEHSIKYTNGNNVQVDDLLNPSARKRIVVRVGYKEDLNSLPEDDIELDLVFNASYSQTNEEEVTTASIVQELKNNNSSCFTKYEGQVTDRVGITETATNVYFDNCQQKRHIIFGGFCWQVIRTTETGGIKMIYNGEPDNEGHCGNSRNNHMGIIGENGTIENLNSEYLYGSSFTYDTTNLTFTLVDTTLATWGDSTYQELIGKYTCKNIAGTCTTLYNVNNYDSSTGAYTTSYTIGSTNYAQIGKSAFNATYSSPPSMAGYMFNKVYKIKSISDNSTYIKYGSTFTYDTETNKYTLSGTTGSHYNTGYAQITGTHYTCWNSSGVCSNISYIYYISSSYAYYIEITDGKGVEDALNEMLSSYDVNKYNSSIKGIIDSWYIQNLSSKTSDLEDTVYCNARNIIELNNWNPDGGSVSNGYSIKFKNYNFTTDLSCPNETDQFAVSNNKAKLTYPVALIGSEEVYNLIYSSFAASGIEYWTLSPYFQNASNTGVRSVSGSGGLGSSITTNYPLGSRPVVSLASSSVIESGDGSEANPWVVE